mmetsp:Transcript_26579/g.85974  ORF Transcript_26579/g.85974 Transcript_26579/m.85974 type:complete len:206 (+) Transcript_26579:810-1427(+)
MGPPGGFFWRRRRCPGPGVQPPPQGGELRDLRRRRPALRVDGRRQEDLHLGVRHSGSHEIHQRAPHGLGARRRTPPLDQLLLRPVPRQPDRHLPGARQDEATPQKKLQGPRQPRLRLRHHLLPGPPGKIPRLRRRRRPPRHLGLQVTAPPPQTQGTRQRTLRRRHLAPRRPLRPRHLRLGRAHQALGIMTSSLYQPRGTCVLLLF